MKFKLRLSVWLLAALLGVLASHNTAWAEDKAKADDETVKRQEVWDLQIKYASYGAGGLCLGCFACWLLTSANQRKKKFADDLKKQDRLDPNEGMPLT